MSRRYLVAAAALALSAPAHAANTDLQTLRTRVYRAIAGEPNIVTLSGSRVVPPSGSPSSGAVSLTGNNPFTQLGYDCTHNVPGETSAALRGPAYAYENGPVIFNLPVGPHKTGTWNLSPAQADMVLDGLTYIEIRSASFPNGAIRCQVQAVNPPVSGRKVWLRVLVKNLGPDTYVGTSPNKSDPWAAHSTWPGSTSAAGLLRVSVDLDEPTGPGLLGPRLAGIFNVQKDFAISLAPMDTVEFDLGLVDGFIPTPGTLTTAAQSIAQSPNVDPNPSNNIAHDEHMVSDQNPSGVPATRTASIATMAVAIVSVTIWTMRRRKAVSSTSGGLA